MNELLKLLSDGRSRTIEMLAAELHSTSDDILRKIDFLERSQIIRRIVTACPESGHCKTCAGCSHGKGKSHCDSCMPEGGFKNMGEMWEVVK